MLLTLADLKAHLRLNPADESEDASLQAYLDAAVGLFRKESKRRWPEEGEPALTKVIDPEAAPLQYRFVAYVDPAVLSPDEQAIAAQWLRLTLGHWYENRQTVIVGVNVTEVPHTAKMLMNHLREPTL